MKHHGQLQNKVLTPAGEFLLQRHGTQEGLKKR